MLDCGIIRFSKIQQEFKECWLLRNTSSKLFYFKAGYNVLLPKEDTSLKLMSLVSSSATEFYKLLKELHELGSVNWELVLSLLGAWTIIFLAVVKGIHSAGKVFALLIFCHTCLG